MTRVNMQIKGVREVKQKLLDLKKRIQNWTPIEDTIHDLFIARMDKAFQTSGRSEGNAWASYGAEPKYAAYKRAMVGHNDLLRWEKGGTYEMLYPSLMEKGHSNHIWNRTGLTSFEYGTSVAHARQIEQDHQGPFGEISAGREFSYIGNATTSMIAETVLDWVLLGKGGSS